MDEKIRLRTLVILGATGIGIATLTALEGRVEWLAAFCGFFGDGCRDTAGFDLLGVPLWLWGIAYYTAVIGAVLFFRPWVFWLVCLGFGVEIHLVGMLIAMEWICAFCILNAIVMALLAALCLQPHRIWQTGTIVLLAFFFANLLMDDRPSLPSAKDAVGPQATIVARVGDVDITSLELESPLASSIYRLDQQIYNMKKYRLEELIDNILLEKAAQEKGISIQELIQSITSGDATASEQEIDRYLQRNQSRLANWNGTSDELRQQVRIYLSEKKYRRLISDWVRPLRDRYPVSVYLKEPPLPFSTVRIEDSPTWGPADAKITIVEFSDYLCPACKRAHETTKKIRDRYDGQIRWVFKDFPLDRHKGAKDLAQAAHCAGEQGRFWEFQDLLFESRKMPDLAQLKKYAAQLGLDDDRFVPCLESGKYLSKVGRDIDAAEESGVNSTPSFVINGKLHPGGLSFEDFSKIVDDELRRAGTIR